MAVDHIAAKTAHRIFINYLRIWTMKQTECRAAVCEEEENFSLSASVCVCVAFNLRPVHTVPYSCYVPRPKGYVIDSVSL